MTIDEFIARLEAVDRNWSLVDGCITSDDELCPIHEVWLASDAGEEEGMLDDYFAEGERLGLSSEDISDIANAADNLFYPELRERLLVACGLSE